MDDDMLYYRQRADAHRNSAARATCDPARLAHLALATAYERRCDLSGGLPGDGAAELRAAPPRPRSV